MIETVKVTIKPGVYLHGCGELLTVEFGEINKVLAIQTIGSNEGKEVKKIILTTDIDSMNLFGRVILDSEYLGVL